MSKRLFTAVHEHSAGITTYLFSMDVPDTTSFQWHPPQEQVIKVLDIDFDEDFERGQECLTIEQQNSIKKLDYPTETT